MTPSPLFVPTPSDGEVHGSDPETNDKAPSVNDVDAFGFQALTLQPSDWGPVERVHTPSRNRLKKGSLKAAKSLPRDLKLSHGRKCLLSYFPTPLLLPLTP